MNRMEFQKTNQNRNNSKKKIITQTTALPILAMEKANLNNSSGITSSTPEAINLNSLKELTKKASIDDNWSESQIDEVNKLITSIIYCLDIGDLKRVELPLLKLINIVDSFSTKSYELLWSTCDVLAKIYSRQGSPEKCLAMLSQSLTIKQTVIGEKDPRYLLTLIDKANCLRDMGDTEISNKLFKMAKELKSEVNQSSLK